MATTSSLFLKNYQTLSGKKTTKPKKLSVGQQFAANLTKFKDITPEPTIDIAKPTNTFGQRLKTAAGKTLQQNIDFFKKVPGFAKTGAKELYETGKGEIEQKKTALGTQNYSTGIKGILQKWKDYSTVPMLVKEKENINLKKQQGIAVSKREEKQLENIEKILSLSPDERSKIKSLTKGLVNQIKEERVGKSLYTGVLGTVKSTIDIYEWISGKETQASKNLEEWDKLLRVENPDLANQIQSAAGSSLPYYAFGGFFGLGSKFLGKVSPLVANIFASGASGFLEASGEAANGYKEVYDKEIKSGKSPSQARETAKKTGDKIFGANVLLNIITNKLGIFGEENNLVKKMLNSAKSEAIQEGTQQVISNVATGKPADEGVALSAIIGGILGSAGGGLIDINGNVAEDTKVAEEEKLTETVGSEVTTPQLRQTAKTRTLITQELVDTNGTVDVNKAISIASLDGVKNTKVGKEIIMKAVQAQQSGEQIKITVPKTGDIQVDLVGVSEDIAEQKEIKIPSEKELKTEKVVEPKAKTTKSVDELSKSAKNSLLNSEVGLKPNAIERAISEIKKGIKPPVKIRVLEDGTIIIEDGRHHLEAARQLGIKNYPIEDVTAQYNQPTKPSPIKTGTTPRPVDTEIGMVSGEPRYKDSAYPKTFTAKNDIPNMGIKKGESVAIHTYNPSSTYEGKPDSFEIILNKPITKDGFTIKRSGFVKSDFINQNFVNSTSPIKTGEVSQSKSPAGFDNLTDNTFKTKGGELVITENTPSGNSIQKLYVDESSRRQGIATKLLEEAKTKYNTISAQVSNEASVKLHYKSGFRPYNNPNATLNQSLDLFNNSNSSSVNMVWNKSAGIDAKPSFLISPLSPESGSNIMKVYGDSALPQTKQKLIERGNEILSTTKTIDNRGEVVYNVKYQPNSVSPESKEVVKERTVEVPRNQLPVGEGEKKVSRLEARVKDVLDTATQDTVDQLGLTTYEELNKKENIAKASEYVINNPDDAIKVLTGEIEAPKGILRNAIYVAMENMAKGDLNLARKLASITSTRLGQEIGILSEIDKESPVRIMKDVIKIKEEAFKKKYGGRKVTDVRSKMVSEIKTEKVSKSSWSNFISSLEC